MQYDSEKKAHNNKRFQNYQNDWHARQRIQKSIVKKINDLKEVSNSWMK